MSQTELQRFAAAVQADPARAEAYAAVATPGDLAVRLRAEGYDVTYEEVADAVLRGEQLSDEQLDQVSGGAIVTTALVGGAIGLGALLVAGVAGLAAWATVNIVRGAQSGAEPPVDPRSYRHGWRG